MITRGSIKKKSPAATTTTTSISLNNNSNNNNQIRRSLGQRVVTIKEPSPEKSASSRSPASISPPSDTDRGVNNQQHHALFQQQHRQQTITTPSQNNNNSTNTNGNNSSLMNSVTSLSSSSVSESEYVRALKSTIAEQRRHLDVARFAIEKEVGEKQSATVRALEAQEHIHQLRQQLDACRGEAERLMSVCEGQRSEIVGLRQQVAEQLTTTQLLSRAADEERANAARILNERDRLREDFDANERVFKELLGALREKEKMPSSMAAAAELSMQLKQNKLREEQQEKKQQQQQEKKQNKMKNSKRDGDDDDEENRPPEVWISAWKQLQQRRLFEKGQSFQ